MEAICSNLKSVTLALELFLGFELLLSTRFTAFFTLCLGLHTLAFFSVELLACSTACIDRIPGPLQSCPRLNLWMMLVINHDQKPLQSDFYHRTNTKRHFQLHLPCNNGPYLLVISAQQYLFCSSPPCSSTSLTISFFGFLILCSAHRRVPGAVHRRRKVFEKGKPKKYEN